MGKREAPLFSVFSIVFLVSSPCWFGSATASLRAFCPLQSWNPLNSRHNSITQSRLDAGVKVLKIQIFTGDARCPTVQSDSPENERLKRIPVCTFGLSDFSTGPVEDEASPIKM